MPPGPDSAFNEEAIVFGTTARLVGVVTAPSATAMGTTTNGVGVVLLNAGVVHRVGPNRLYVRLARRLSRLGFTVLRFDHSGVGDSPTRDDHVPFADSSVAEARDAMDWLAAKRGCDSFVLVGLCSGTLTAFRAAQADARVVKLVLLTALLVDPSTVPQEIVSELANRRVARSYVVEKIGSLRAWRKMLTGGLDLRRVSHVLRRFTAGTFRGGPKVPGSAEVVAQLQQLLDRGVGVRFIYADPATVLENFRLTIAPELSRLQQHGRIDVNLVRQADHTFTRLRHQARVVELVSEWLTPCT